MKILLTGATGYIAKKLLPSLLSDGHEVFCCVRDKRRFDSSRFGEGNIRVIEADFLKPETLGEIPETLDAAYYLIHSMSSSIDHFDSLEKTAAENFCQRMTTTTVKQVIYLSGISNAEGLSKHLQSRLSVEEILSKGSFALTTLRAGIIVGSGSASFEIIRDLVEKLPVMVAPRWLNTRTQPIAVRNITEFLHGVLLRPDTYNRSFDVGGPEVLTYREMLLQFARVRGLKRHIFVVPVMTPKLSSYWLYFITSTSYKLAVNLVHSMKVEVIGRPNDLSNLLGIKLISYREAVEMAFGIIGRQAVSASWTDALSSQVMEQGIEALSQVPEHGCYHDKRSITVSDEEKVLHRIWTIGGKNGWYYGNWLWKARGFADKLTGGVGLRRGRRNPAELMAGDALDFWRVVVADKNQKRLLLYAEMKLPGEAWLEFALRDGVLYQTATFRPLGIWGRLYWMAVWPFHIFIFGGMLRHIGYK